MKILIIGGGATGLTLANILEKEHQVVLIEFDEEIAKDIAEKTSAMVIHGDGSDIEILKEAGISEIDALVTTADDKTNLMVAQIAKGENIPKIITMVHEPKNEELFTHLGVNNLVSSVNTDVKAIRQMLYQVGDARIIAQLGGGEMQIVELNVSQESPLAGKKTELKNASIAAIYRSGELIIPNKKTKIAAGDLLLLVAKTEDLPELTDLITQT